MAIRDSKPLSPKRTEIFWSYVDRSGDEDACWLWTGCTNKHGYGVFSQDGKAIRAHRIAYFLTYGVDPGSLFCCHTCDNRACVRPSHIFLGNQSDNMRDAAAKGRCQNGDAHYMRRHPELRTRGERKGISKLKDADIVEIRRLYATGEWFQKEIAAKFGVTQATIWAVLSGKTWTHI